MLYKYRSLDNYKHILDILLNKRLYAANFRELNDPMEGEFTYSKKIPKHVTDRITSCENTRITSLSRRNDSALMWSYYADSHKGIVVGLEIDESVYDIRPIKYLNEYYHLENGWVPAIGNVPHHILSVKGYDWKHEEEVRVFVEDGSEFVKVKILEVIIGRYMPDQDLELLVKLIERVDDKIIIKMAIEM